MKIRLLFFMIFVSLSGFAQGDINGVVKFITNPAQAVDSTSVQPVFRRKSDGRLMRMTWGQFATYISGGGSGTVPDLQQVMNAGSTASGLTTNVNISTSQQINIIADGPLKIGSEESTLLNTGTKPVQYIGDVTPNIALDNDIPNLAYTRDKYVSYMDAPYNVDLGLKNISSADFITNSTIYRDGKIVYGSNAILLPIGGGELYPVTAINNTFYADSNGNVSAPFLTPDNATTDVTLNDHAIIASEAIVKQLTLTDSEGNIKTIVVKSNDSTVQNTVTLPNTDGVLLNSIKLEGITYSPTDTTGLVDLGTRSDASEDMFIATSSGVNEDGSVKRYLGYISDIFRKFELQAYSPWVINTTNEIVRNGNDLFVLGDWRSDSNPHDFVVALKGMKIVNDIMTFQSITFQELPIANTVSLHSLIYSDGFLYTGTRPNSTSVAKIMLKINAYNLADIKTLTFPNDSTTGPYSGDIGDIDVLGEYIYALFSRAFTTGSLVRIAKDFNSYSVLVSLGATGTSNRIGSVTPFSIYNNKFYIPTVNTQGAANPTLSYNTIGIAVYDLKGTLLSEATGLVVDPATTGTTIAVAHWMTIFNNKILINCQGNNKFVRIDATTLAVEETYALPQKFTNGNSMTRAGEIYLNGEGTSNGILLKFNDYRSFAGNTTIPVPTWYSSSGSGNPKIINDVVLLNTSQLNNNGQDGSSIYTTKFYVDSQIAGSGTTYTAGTGLLLSSNVFSADPSYISTATTTALNGKQATLVSGTNIKTVGTQSLVGSGNITEVQNSLTASTVLAPSVSSVNTGLGLKADKASGNNWTATQTPGATNTYDLGTAALMWNRGYFTTLRTVNIGTVTTGQNLIFLTAGTGGQGATMFNTTSNWRFGTTTTDTGDKIQVEGTGLFTGTVTAAAGTASNHLITKGQFSITNTAMTTTQTAATLNTAYPTATDGFRVTAPNVPGSGTGMMYIKTSVTGQWISVPTSVLNP